MDGFGWRVAYRLGTGSMALGAWCWRQSAAGTIAAAGTVVALPVYEPASVLLVPAFAWGAAAWALGTPAPVDAPPEAESGEHEEEPEDGRLDDEHDCDVNEPDVGERSTGRNPEQVMREYVERVVAINRQRKRQGVHIRALLEDLQHYGTLPGWKPADLRRHLEQLGIPVRDGLGLVIDGKKINRPGIHHDDLARALGRTPALPPQLVPDLTPR